MEELEKNGVKLWLLSEDSERVNKVDYEAIDLYENYHAPFKIKGTNERKVEESIKGCLKELTQQFAGYIKEPAESKEEKLSPQRKTSKGIRVG